MGNFDRPVKIYLTKAAVLTLNVGQLCFSVDTQQEALQLMKLVGRSDVFGYALNVRWIKASLPDVTALLSRHYKRLRLVEKRSVKMQVLAKSMVERET